jgi:DNA-binding transcriptional MerR regulator
MPDLPTKLFFRIGEVARLVGVEPHVVRYWEREFRSIRPTKSAKGQRVYSRKDVENLLRVRDLLYRDGFTIAGAKKKLSRASLDTSDAELAPEGAPEPSAAAAPSRGEPAAPTGEPPSEPAARDVRAKLLALRGEIEDFLAELSGD